MVTLRNPRVIAIHPDSVTHAVTSVACGSFQLRLPIFAMSGENSYCLSNGYTCRQASVPGPSLGSKRFGPGNPLRCPRPPRIRDLLWVVRGQDVEEEINSPGYLICVTREGATRLHQNPEGPLPLHQLIFLNSAEDICRWLLANNGHNPLDLLVLESRFEDGNDLDGTCEPPNGTYPFSPRRLG